jgi:hypothetical protein
MVLLHAMLVLVILSQQPTAARSATLNDDPAPEATATPTEKPATEAAPSAPAEGPAESPPQAVVPSGNNIIGLNVARLRRDRYIWAAAELVNANGGDWGYLTVVFTATERDGPAGEQLLRELLDRCYESHLQPIIRVATRFDEGAETWSRPEPDDAERWRAFLEKGSWPTRRVWVIAGNEPNLGREWGGEVDSTSYAEYLSHFIDVFADSDRFKVVNGPLDASNTSEMPKMQDAYEFIAGMDAAVPGIFSRLSGWASNPYSVPNQGPELRYTHRAYEAELDAIGRDMPVLITEAGHLNTGDDKEVAAFYEGAFRDWMADSRVVAVTPLFWHPDRGVYWMFDFDKNSKVVEKSPTYDLIMHLPRMRGSPDYVPDFENVARGGHPQGPKPSAVALAPRPSASTSNNGSTEEGAAAGPSEAAEATPPPATRTPLPSAPPTATPMPPTPTSRTAVVVPSFGGTPAPSPVASTGPGAPTSSNTISRFFKVGNTDGDPVRVRSMPSRSSPAIASVTEGTRVQGLGTSQRGEDLVWQRIRISNGTEGWIATDFLTPD